MSARRVSLVDRIAAAVTFWTARNPMLALVLFALGIGAAVRLVFEGVFLLLWGISVW